MNLIKEYACPIRLICAVFIMLLFLPLLNPSDRAYGQEDQLELGKRVYQERCLICHGIKGDGKGLVGTIRRSELNGRVIEVVPRDFEVGSYRFRTTPTGCLPADEDLMLTITEGITRSFMPPHKDLSKEERVAVIEYIKMFTDRWDEEDPCEPMTVKKPDWVGSPASVAKGKEVYEAMKCFECHGHTGLGDGPKSEDLKDDWGKKILPFNFTTGALKRGSTPENIYLTFSTGLDGSSMPSYEESPNEEDRWHLVSYTLDIMKRKGRKK